MKVLIEIKENDVEIKFNNESFKRSSRLAVDLKNEKDQKYRIEVYSYDNEYCDYVFEFDLTDSIKLLSAKKIVDGVEHNYEHARNYDIVEVDATDDYFEMRKYFCCKYDTEGDNLYMYIEKLTS